MPQSLLIRYYCIRIAFAIVPQAIVVVPRKRAINRCGALAPRLMLDESNIESRVDRTRRKIAHPGRANKIAVLPGISSRRGQISASCKPYFKHISVSAGDHAEIATRPDRQIS